MSTLPKSNEKIVKILKEIFFSFGWLAVILLIADIVTKICAMQYLKFGNSVVVIPHLLNLTLTYNTGAAWGLGGDNTWSRIILIIISWAAMIFIIGYYIWKYKSLSKFYKAVLMVILAGDVGNLIDRTFFYERGVVDFLDITPLIPKFGIFNFADSCLVVGIFMLVIYYFVLWIKELKEERKRNIEEEKHDDSGK